VLDRAAGKTLLDLVKKPSYPFKVLRPIGTLLPQK
jgi:hypothetical protein